MHLSVGIKEESAEARWYVEGADRSRVLVERDLLSGGGDGNGYTALLPPMNPSQLTIFYNGSICVFDSITPEKAEAIMLIASATAAASAAANIRNTKLSRSASSAGAVVSPTRSPSTQSSIAGATTTVNSQSQGLQPPIQLLQNTTSLCKLQAELPIARRHSLQRFLEKRRDRFVSKPPYTSKMPETSGSDVHDEPSSPSSCFNDSAEHH